MATTIKQNWSAYHDTQNKKLNWLAIHRLLTFAVIYRVTAQDLEDYDNFHPTQIITPIKVDAKILATASGKYDDADTKGLINLLERV